MGEQTENLLAYLTGRDQPVKAKYREARRSFWAYCKLMNPGFFREDRPHLRELAETLQALEEGTLYAPDGSVCRRLAISEPPRHGKSYTMTLFNQWCFGRNAEDRIINVSYNETLSSRFSKGVRDGIDATKVDPSFTVFSHQARRRGGTAMEPRGKLFLLSGRGHGRHDHRRGLPEAHY